jgi:uncharacterized protein YoxC
MYAIIDEKITQALAPVIADVDGLKTRVTTLETDFDSLSEQVTINSNRITNLTSQIQGLASTVSGVMSDISNINTDIENIEIDINFLRNEVGTHTEEIADIYNKIAEIDPDTGLIVDARNFNIEPKTASVLDDTILFNLEGNTKEDIYFLWPDKIPGTQTGYYPRVTMQTDAVTGKIKLPSDLTTGTYPTIIRGTYATNVQSNGTVWSGDPIEYSIDGRDLIINGYDDHAIMLMCIASLHRGVEQAENLMTMGTNTPQVYGVPIVENDGYVSFRLLHTVDNCQLYAFCFAKDGTLLDQIALSVENLDYECPAGTWSIWLGIGARTAHETWTNTTFGIIINGGGGMFYYDTYGVHTKNIVMFTGNDGETWYVYNISSEIDGIKPLLRNMRIDMMTGDIFEYGSKIDTAYMYGSLNGLVQNVNYNVDLQFVNSGYLKADLYYNKVAVMINGLDANNARY